MKELPVAAKPSRSGRSYLLLVVTTVVSVVFLTAFQRVYTHPAWYSGSLLGFAAPHAQAGHLLPDLKRGCGTKGNHVKVNLTGRTLS